MWRFFCTFAAVMIDGENIGNEIKRLRTAAGLSLRELSALCGVPHTSIYLIEAGRKSPQFATIVRILSALRYTLTITPARKSK